jgi:cell cycle sensor histidine kinase DivJ
MALGAALLLIGGLAVGPSQGVAVRAALAVMAAPALAGILLRFRADSRRDRLLVLGGWGLAAISASALSGGMSGPLTGLLVLPVAAGLLLGGATWGMTGGLVGLGATATAILVGLLSVWMAGAAPDAPLLSSGAALLAVLGAAAALRWTWGPREAAAALAGQALRRAEDLVAAQPGLTLILTPQGGLLGAQGRAPPALDVVAVGEQGLVALTHAPDRPRLLEGLARAAAQSGDAEPVQIVLTPREALDRRVTLYVRRLDAPTGVASAAPAASPAASARLIAQAFDGTAQFAREHGLETARAEAAARDAGKSRFLANMSHELRTPLNAVLGFADIMRARLFGPLPDRYAEYASSIHEAGGHLLNLINDVLDVSKIEADRYELSRERFDGREAVSAAVALVRLAAEDKGLGLQAVLPSEPIQIDADRRALQQITLNLLSNAVKFTPTGGAVTATLAAVGPYLELVVADTGVGVAPEDLKRLGRPFEQAGGSEQRAQGTGLGLSLVRSLAELHGGRMSIESTLGEGTAVTVRLPVVEMASPRTLAGPDDAAAEAVEGVIEGGAEIIPLHPTPQAPDV